MKFHLSPVSQPVAAAEHMVADLECGCFGLGSFASTEFLKTGEFALLLAEGSGVLPASFSHGGVFPGKGITEAFALIMHTLEWACEATLWVQLSLARKGNGFLSEVKHEVFYFRERVIAVHSRSSAYSVDTFLNDMFTEPNSTILVLSSPIAVLQTGDLEEEPDLAPYIRAIVTLAFDGETFLLWKPGPMFSSMASRGNPAT